MDRFCEFDWDEHNEQHLAKHAISRSDAEDATIDLYVQQWGQDWI